MKFVPLKRDLFLKSDLFHVAGNPVGVLGGYFTITKSEKETVTKYCEKVWKEVSKKTGGNFRGHIRFDVVPHFTHGEGIGTLCVDNVYEVNAHSPECVAADASLAAAFPEMKEETPSAPRTLAKFLKHQFGEICMVRGRCVAKDSWGDHLISEMRKEGLALSVLSEKEAMERSPGSLWRWGNVDLAGKEEFGNDFKEWLYKRKNGVFNTVSLNDVADKRHVMTSKDVVLLPRNIPFILSFPPKEWVIKPFRGSSGNGIFFGKDFLKEEWKSKLYELSDGSYGAFRAKWLPGIEVKGEKIVIDISPSFFANGEDLHYLYTPVRAVKQDDYRKSGVINVTTGGGYGNTLKEI